MFEELFVKRKANFERIVDYGFVSSNDQFVYTTNILDNTFELCVFIDDKGNVATRLFEIDTDEEYVLYKTDAQGSFVGSVRLAIAKILQDISNKCFDSMGFRSEYTEKAVRYVKDKYDRDLEFLWDDTPDSGIWRRADNNKWFGIIQAIPKKKLDGKSEEIVEIINLKGKPETIASIVDGKRFYPAWHMNKKHWYTVILDGSVDLEEIVEGIDTSYLLVK